MAPSLWGGSTAWWEPRIEPTAHPWPGIKREEEEGPEVLCPLQGPTPGDLRTYQTPPASTMPGPSPRHVGPWGHCGQGASPHGEVQVKVKHEGGRHSQHRGDPGAPVELRAVGRGQRCRRRSLREVGILTAEVYGLRKGESEGWGGSAPPREPGARQPAGKETSLDPRLPCRKEPPPGGPDAPRGHACAVFSDLNPDRPPLH